MNLTTNATATGSSSDLTVFGFTFDPDSPFVILQFILGNVIVSSMIPLPLSSTFMVVGALLFGFAVGMAIKVSTTAFGAWLSLLAVRYGCRPCLERRLSNKWRRRYEALVAALTEHSTRRRSRPSRASLRKKSAGQL